MKNLSKSLFCRIFFSFFIAVLITAISPTSGNKSFVAYACAANEASLLGFCIPWFVKSTPTPSFIWCGRTGAWELPGNCPPPNTTPTTPPVNTDCPSGQVRLAGGQCVSSGNTGDCPSGQVRLAGGQCVSSGNTGDCPSGQVQIAGHCVVEGSGNPTNTPVGNPTSASCTPGASCGTCSSLTCSNGASCASGHNYCVYDGKGNHCGSCVTEVNNCSSQCGGAPPVAAPTNRPSNTGGTTGGHGTPSNPLPIGYLDQATCNNFSGWTCDPSNFQSSIRVDFYADGLAGTGKGIGSTTASSPRSDLGHICGGNSSHAFNVAPPGWLKDNKEHTIYAYGIGAKANTLLTNQKKITCTSSTSSLTASIYGPATGIPGRQVGPFTATAAGTNLEYIRMYYARTTADLTQASSFTLFGQNNTCSGTRCSATGTIASLPAGEYYVEVAANDKGSNQHCSANFDHVPAGSGWRDCGRDDKITLRVATATPLPSPTPTRTASRTPTPTRTASRTPTPTHGVTPTVTSAPGTPTPTTSVSTTPTSADIDDDKCTGPKDLSAWISAYQNNATSSNPANINGIGAVDLLDYNYWYLAFTNSATTKCSP